MEIVDDNPMPDGTEQPTQSPTSFCSCGPAYGCDSCSCDISPSKPERAADIQLQVPQSSVGPLAPHKVLQAFNLGDQRAQKV